MENGSLSDIIKRFGVLNESLAAIYISQVLKGLEYLHNQGVIHRDIKVSRAPVRRLRARAHRDSCRPPRAPTSSRPSRATSSWRTLAWRYG